MRTRHAIVLYILGLALNAIGAILKIMHFQGGDEALILATVFQVSGCLLFIFKLLTNPRLKDFLDW